MKKNTLKNYTIKKLLFYGMDKKDSNNIKIEFDNTFLLRLNNSIKFLKNENKSVLKLSNKNFIAYTKNNSLNKKNTVIKMSKKLMKFINEFEYLAIYSCTHNYTQIFKFRNFYFIQGGERLYKNLSSLKKLV